MINKKQIRSELYWITALLLIFLSNVYAQADDESVLINRLEEQRREDSAYFEAEKNLRLKELSMITACSVDFRSVRSAYNANVPEKGEWKSIWEGFAEKKLPRRNFDMRKHSGYTIKEISDFIQITPAGRDLAKNYIEARDKRKIRIRMVSKREIYLTTKQKDVAVFDPDSMIIYVSSDVQFGSAVQALTHELAHVVDYAQAMESLETRKKLVSITGECVSVDGTGNVSEYCRDELKGQDRFRREAQDARTSTIYASERNVAKELEARIPCYKNYREERLIVDGVTTSPRDAVPVTPVRSASAFSNVLR